VPYYKVERGKGKTNAEGQKKSWYFISQVEPTRPENRRNTDKIQMEGEKNEAAYCHRESRGERNRKTKLVAGEWKKCRTFQTNMFKIVNHCGETAGPGTLKGVVPMIWREGKRQRGRKDGRGQGESATREGETRK